MHFWLSRLRKRKRKEPSNNMDQIDLSDFFKTKAEATDFAARLGAVSAMIYHTGFNLEQELIRQFGLRKKDRFLTILRENNISIESTQAIKEFFTKLQQMAASIPVLSIILPFEPTDQTLAVLSDWCMLNIKKQMLFDLQVDQRLIGGAAIQYNGKYLDFSVRPKVEATIRTLLAQESEQGKQQVPTPPPSPATHQSTEHMTVGR